MRIRLEVVVVSSLFITTGLFIAASVIVFLNNYNSDSFLSDFGTFFGAVFSSVALLWLMASHMIARRDVRDQHNILSQQLKAMNETALQAQGELFFMTYTQILPTLFSDAKVIASFLMYNLRLTPSFTEQTEFSTLALTNLARSFNELEDLVQILSSALASPGTGLVVGAMRSFVGKVEDIELRMEKINSLPLADSRTLFLLLLRLKRKFIATLSAYDARKPVTNNDNSNSSSSREHI